MDRLIAGREGPSFRLHALQFRRIEVPHMARMGDGFCADHVIAVADLEILHLQRGGDLPL